MNTSNPLEKSAAEHEPLPDPDPENPVTEPHGSHDWILSNRFAQCATCGARDHWPAARQRCPGNEAPKRGSVTLAEAMRALYLDLDAFCAWWTARGSTLGYARPSMDEWAAEFSEWRIKR